MGWFRGQTYIRCPHHEFFVPEWGWVGSKMTIYFDMDGTFSSPSGDGLVPSTLWMVGLIYIFSSPSGVGLVLSIQNINSFKMVFSSPSGDGLVHYKSIKGESTMGIFVPAWGWVGSMRF